MFAVSAGARNTCTKTLLGALLQLQPAHLASTSLQFLLPASQNTKNKLFASLSFCMNQTSSLAQVSARKIYIINVYVRNKRTIIYHKPGSKFSEKFPSVLDFNLRQTLRQMPQPNTVPTILSGNFKLCMKFEYPLVYFNQTYNCLAFQKHSNFPHYHSNQIMWDNIKQRSFTENGNGVVGWEGMEREVSSVISILANQDMRETDLMVCFSSRACLKIKT